MSTTSDSRIGAKVYTTHAGHVVIEQAQSPVVLQSADQILAIINELHACYDYCATWKDVAPNPLTVPASQS